MSIRPPGHATHGVLAPQGLGPAHGVTAPCGGDACRETERCARSRVVAHGDGHAALGEAGRLVDQQPANADVDGQSGHAVSEHEAEADVKASAYLRVAAVLADAHFDARCQCHPAR